MKLCLRSEWINVEKDLRWAHLHTWPRTELMVARDNQDDHRLGEVAEVCRTSSLLEAAQCGTPLTAFSFGVCSRRPIPIKGNPQVGWGYFTLGKRFPSATLTWFSLLAEQFTGVWPLALTFQLRGATGES